MLYIQILETKKSEKLRDIIFEHFTIIQQESFIKDVIVGNDLLFLKPWLTKELHLWEQAIFNLNEGAINFLISLGRHWLNQHHKLLEEIYENNWLYKNQILIRLNYIISESQGGVRAPFLQYMVKYARNNIEEVSLILLSLKIKEVEPDFDPLRYQKKIPILKKPYLFIIPIYLFREKNPLHGILYLLAFQQETLSSEAFDKGGPSEKLLDLGEVYLRQAIFNQLNDASEEDYQLFIKRISKFQIDWIMSFINKALQHSSLKKIKDKLDASRSSYINREQQREALSQIEQERNIV